MAGARLRFQGEHRYYLDFELAMSRRDSNTVSDDIDGPEGRAFRWFLTTDSTQAMKSFPVAFSVYGNYVEEGFNISDFKGEDDDWNSYKLRDEWDLDSSLLSRGALGTMSSRCVRACGKTGSATCRGGTARAMTCAGILRVRRVA